MLFKAALGISDLIVMAMVEEGMTIEEARDRIWLLDSAGLVTLSRGTSDDPHKMQYAKQATDTQNLEEIVDLVRPSCLIGQSELILKTISQTIALLRSVGCFGRFYPNYSEKGGVFPQEANYFRLIQPHE